MTQNEMVIKRFFVDVDGSPYKVEALCIECGNDLIVVVGGGSHYHCGTVALTISMPSIKDPQKPTNSTYQVPVPGHKEEALAREGSFRLSHALRRNVVMSVGIHEDNLPKDRILVYNDHFYRLIDLIAQAYSPR